MASRRGGITNFFSAILQVDRHLSQATLAATGQQLVISVGSNSAEILALLDKVDSWHERMQREPSVTQSDIAKEEGVHRSRVGQLLELHAISHRVRQQLSGGADGSVRRMSVNQLRKLARR